MGDGGFDAWMMARQYAAETRRVYGIYVRKAGEFCDLDAATTEELADWLETLRGSAPSRIAARKALILYFTSIGRDPNPAEKLPRLPEPHRLPRPLSEGEHRRWIAAAHELGGIQEVAGLLMATTGARIGEVRQAQWADLYLTEPGYWRVRGKGARRQGPRWRQQPLHPVVVGLLAGWRTPGTFVFPGARGPLSDGAMRKLLVEVGARAGLGYVTPHRIRHSVATYVLEHTGNMKAAQELLGHATMNPTMVYAQLLPERLRSVVNELPA